MKKSKEHQPVERGERAIIHICTYSCIIFLLDAHCMCSMGTRSFESVVPTFKNTEMATLNVRSWTLSRVICGMRGLVLQ